MSETDLDYNFESSVTSDNGAVTDADQDNLSLLKKHLKDVKESISKHNSFDVIDLNSKHSVEVQIMANKMYVKKLKQFELDLTSKVEELTNG